MASGNKAEIEMHCHSGAQTSKTDCSGMVDNSANISVKKERAVILEEWIFTNVNTLSFAGKHRVPGTDVIYSFG
jgi:hypothetical protein